MRFYQWAFSGDPGAYDNPIRLTHNYNVNKKITRYFNTFTETGSADWIGLNNLEEFDAAYASYSFPVDIVESPTIDGTSINNIPVNFWDLWKYGSQADSMQYAVYFHFDDTYIDADVTLLIKTEITISGVLYSTNWTSNSVSDQLTMILVSAPVFLTKPTWAEINSSKIYIKVQNNNISVLPTVLINNVSIIINYHDTDMIGRTMEADLGRLDYDGFPTYGTYHRNAENSAETSMGFQESGGGLIVETLWKITGNVSDKYSWQDSFIISIPKVIEETIATYLKYDSLTPSQYDLSGMKYDIGVMLQDQGASDYVNSNDGMTFYDVNLFQDQYEYKTDVLNLPADVAKQQMLIEYDGISEQTFNIIIGL